MDTFLAIEKVLHFHHLTSRQPLRVSQLRFRAFQNGTPITQQSINEIKQVWPEAYHFYTLKGQPVVEALDLPLKAQERKQKFESLYKDKENNLGATSIATKSFSEKTTVDRQVLKPILMGHLRNQINANSNISNSKISLGLLDRIRTKESRLKALRSPHAIKSARDNFLRSQVPKLVRVLSDVAAHEPYKSVQMENIMEILRTNLYRLSDEEIARTLRLAVQMYPSFCSIVKVGETECVKLVRESINVC